MLDTRSNLIYIILIINYYAYNSIKLYERVVKRIFYYLKETISLKLVF